MAQWLQSVNLADYTALFAEHEITLDVLPHLTADDIAQLGLPIGPRRRLIVGIEGLAAATRAVADVERAAFRPDDEIVSRGGERRQLTVMFCDLVGSSALAGLLDPEELLELMRGYRAACTAVVSRYEGHVAQYLGDGLMVYFGWPSAHEDDAERGVRAALEMVQAVKRLRVAQPLAVRIGLATGPVVVGHASRLENAEARLAVGETPNLAARLQAIAAADEVVIAPTTRRLVLDAFSLTDLGARSIMGFAHPVQTFRVDAAREAQGRFKAAHGEMELPPLVGREEESTLLERCWKMARHEAGQLVLVGGQAGIGKSRLTQALREQISEPHTALHYQCSPYHLNSPLHPVIEQLEHSAGFAREDSPDQRLEKLEAVLGGDSERIAGTAPLFAALLSLPIERYPPLQLSPQKRKEKTLEALVGQIEATARRNPVLLVVEDVHWIDPTSQELLELLVTRIRELPVLLVMTFRLEYEPLWEGQPGVSKVTLQRLGRSEGARLIDAVSQHRALPQEVLEEILARTDGVPLFVEELTRSVLESGLLRQEGDHYALDGPLAALAIPVSLRDSLMARLDRLGAVKELAQIGACIGREFSYALIERVSTLPAASLEASLERLVDAGLVTRRDDPPDAIYTFRHALVQDAAYESLLRSRRVELHASIAHVLETEFADRVAATPEWLAHHHTQANHLYEAIPLWREAGSLAVKRVALKEAIAHFKKGLTLIGQLPPTAERDRLELTIREPLNAAWTGLRGWADAEVGVNAAAIHRLAESQGNARSLLLAKWWVWTSTITQGRIADSGPWVDRLLAEEANTEQTDRIFGHATAMVQHFLSGELTESREHADRALALYDPRSAQRWIQLTGYDMRTFVQVYECQLIWMLGYPDRAVRVADASCAHARSDGHAFGLVWAPTFSSYVFAYRREPDRFVERVSEADRIAREQGIAFIYEVSVPQAKGIVELQNGRPHEAAILLREGITRWTKVGGNVRIPYVKSVLAEAVALGGDLDGAAALIEECLEQIARPAWNERLWLAEVLRLKGSILMRQGRPAEAEVQLRESIECARRQQAKSWELRSSTMLAAMMARGGRVAEARELLAPVYGWFTEGFGTRDLLEAKTLLAELSSG
ncbi:MAG TPA: AAA family ATPase [Gemmatimonadaceae bacterium]|jgi:class 3 adenylate cyclase|nr:AAA family ATPase [Gemmatimonadaceae bacterium]